MIEELSSSDLTVQQFLDDLSDRRGYTSILFPVTDNDLASRNRTFFYDGILLEYQVGTKKLVNATVDGDQFAVLKDGKKYTGAKARALFKSDRDFKLWRRSNDGETNDLLHDACASMHLYQLNAVCAWKELQLPQEFSFCKVRELMAFILSRDFEAVQARYLPLKKD
jgi:hypothetical protein